MAKKVANERAALIVAAEGNARAGNAARRFRFVLLAKLTASALLASPIAWAGGGEDDATSDVATEGPSYYGFVWDTRGATVSGAVVSLRGKTGKPAEQKTNLLGMYRTHINKDVKPADAVMTCAKEGYRQAKVVRRNVPDAMAARVQIDCVLQKS
jgi:hypothetical protein